jgi:hypothetical protein
VYRILFFIILIISGYYIRAQEVTLTSSNLPIIVITTENGTEIPNEPKIKAHLGIIENGAGIRNNLTDPFTDYDGIIGIEIRGNMSSSFPKKPYVFETRDSTGANLNVSLLGMPRENDWILRAAYIDKTLMRDHLAYYLSRQSGRWASRTRHCELTLNGVYQGVYILTEKIKPDKNRLGISKMDADDIAGDSLTGGYIYEIAQAGEDFGLRRRYKYPKADVITQEQKAYIRKYDDDFRAVMESNDYDDPVAGYPAWIDVDRFIDEILVQEACKNSDAYGWSSYFHKDRLGKLCGGPAWDFDQALSNSTFNDGPNYQEWIVAKSNVDPWLEQSHPPFWRKLFAETKFKTKLAQRWFALRANVWATDTIMEFIDSNAAYLDEAQARNFSKWPILGVEIWRSTPGWDERDTYQKEVGYLKDFLINRLNWIDENLAADSAFGPVNLKKGLVAYYQMDEGSGSLVVNSAPGDGLAPDGRLVYSPQWVDGKYGKALHFQSDQKGYVYIGRYDPSGGADALSVSCWINWEGLDGNWHGICGKRNAWDPESMLWSMVLDNTNGGIQFETNTAEYGKVFIMSPAPPVQKWVHVALVYQGSTATFYFDGKQVVEGAMILGQNRDARLFFGCGEADGVAAFSGIIDELRFYNRKLNPEEITALYNYSPLLDSAANDEESLITGYKLFQNFPNPFNNSTLIKYQLPTAGNVVLNIYNLLGQKAATLVSEKQESGYHTVVWNTDRFTSGVYFCKITAGEFIQMKKMILLR